MLRSGVTSIRNILIRVCQIGVSNPVRTGGSGPDWHIFYYRLNYSKQFPGSGSKKIISFKNIQKYREKFIKNKISIRTQRPEYPSALRDQKSIKRSISVTIIQIYREIFIKSGIFVRILISIVSGRNIHQKKHHQQNASFCFLPKMRGFQKFIRLNIQRVIYVPGWKRCRAKKGGER